eukprot:m.330279 g.330279  ORF g.330279 m.330279 type:complete len:95 (+) comp55608_c0_seq9:752-1036(+)
MPFFVCLFVAFSSLRNILPENSSMFSLSAVSGVVMNTPMDVVKSRMQNQPPGVAKYVWTLPSLLSILREEGPRMLQCCLLLAAFLPDGAQFAPF